MSFDACILALPLSRGNMFGSSRMHGKPLDDYESIMTTLTPSRPNETQFNPGRPNVHIEEARMWSVGIPSNYQVLVPPSKRAPISHAD